MDVSIRNLGRVLVASALGLSVGCAPEHSGHLDKANSSSTASTPIAGYHSDPVLESASISILQNNCASCHGGSSGPGGVSNITIPSALIQSGLVTPGNPNVGRLIGSISEGRMPPTGPMSAANLQTLKDWISSMSVDSGALLPPPPPPPPLEPKFASIKANILVPKCTACHGATVARSGIRYDSYSNAMASGTIRAGNSSNSKIFQETQSGSMPPSRNGYQPLTATELTVLRQWIDAGALNN